MVVLIKNIIKKKKKSNVLLYSFLGNLIKRGRGVNSYKVYIELLEFLKEYKDISNEKEIQKLFLEILSRLKPSVGIRIKKVAGISYQLPCPISDERASKMAISWFFKALQQRSEKKYSQKVKSEILDIMKGKGFSLQKKNSLEKVAVENRPFLHFLKR